MSGKLPRGLKISRARRSDAISIYLMGKRIHELDFSRKYPFHELSEIKEFISIPGGNIFFVARLNGAIVGFIYAKILSHHAGGWCMLDNLAVEKDYRMSGIGDALLRALYRELKRRKVWYVQILEEVHQKRTRKFWKAEGFRETKTFVWAEKAVR